MSKPYKERTHNPAFILADMRSICWAAGFLEGEGHFCGPKALRATASQREDRIEPVARLEEILGGRLYYVPNSNGLGTAQIRWECYGARARGIMMTLYRLFSDTKRKQIREALGVQN